MIKLICSAVNSALKWEGWMAYWIVVVDDDAIELRNAKMHLEGADLRVSCLRSGADLLKFLDSNTPDLVLLDILMPEMDGFETFHLLRELEEKKGSRTTPVIFLSGDTDKETERRVLKEGASDFIKKPFDKEALISRVKKAIENQKTIEMLTEKASVDKLTGFLNKASGTEKIKKMCLDSNGALMLFDLDNFKLVNDIYGHDMGDQVLIAFSEILRHSTRVDDVISRIGGDEFLAFFSNLTYQTAVKALVDRVNDQIIGKCIELMGQEFNIPIGISVGVAFVPEHSRDYQALFRYVDSAMYKVKQNGKHGVRIHDEKTVVMGSKVEGSLDVDMAHINQILEERGDNDGAMVMGKDTFIQAYRFALRFLRRYEKGAGKVLLSLAEEGTGGTLSEFAPKFIEVLQKKLRKSDIIMQLRLDQIVVFLPLVTIEEGEMVAGRLKQAFDEMGAEGVSLRYVTDHISFE